MFKIFKLATEISDPLALAGFVVAILFFTFSRTLKGKPGAETIRHIINATLILALVAMFLGTAGWVWANTGKTSIEGTVYFKNDFLPYATVNVLEIERSDRTSEHGRFSIPITKEETRKSYIFRVSYHNYHQFVKIEVSDYDLSDLQFTLKDTVSIVANPVDTSSDINVKYVDVKQILPIVPAQLSLRHFPVYAEQLQLQLLISHNQKTSHQVHLRSMKIEAEEFKLKAKEANSLDYVIDIDKIKGYGIVNVDEYVIDLADHLKFSARLIKNKDHALQADPDNLFNTEHKTTAFNLDASNDAYLQKKMNVQLSCKGIFRLRFRIDYDNTDASKTRYSPWIYIIRK